MVNADKNIKLKKIGLFDSGIGGFSILSELFKTLPQAEYYYISDDAHAPYGPKSDEFITARSIEISKQLMSLGVDLIVVACNTATAASVDALRSYFPNFIFVGVEPYLNAYYKIPETLNPVEKKMMVLTTVSTGKSERFKRLKERLDPNSEIDHYGLPNLARIIEEYYYAPTNFSELTKKINDELSFLKNMNYS
jgi:glutamate racemase